MSDDLEHDEGFRPVRGERPPTRRRDEDDRPRRRRDRDDLEPIPESSGSGGAGKTIAIVLGVIALVGFCAVASVVGLIAWGVYSVRNKVTAAAVRMETTNNYKMIGLAIHNYHDKTGALPAVAMPTRDGKPGLSWRVAILPYLDQEPLYRQFKVDEAWNSPTNLRVAEQMPFPYGLRRDGGGNMTHARLFVGRGAMFDPTVPRRTFAQIKDGLSNTFMVVESTNPVMWTQPDELRFDPKGALPPLGMPENDYFIVVYGDGSVRPVKKTVNPEKIKLAIGAEDGQIVNLDE